MVDTGSEVVRETSSKRFFRRKYPNGTFVPPMEYKRNGDGQMKVIMRPGGKIILR